MNGSMISRLGTTVHDEILRFAARPATSVTLKQLLEFGQNVKNDSLIQSAQFLHNELPVRLARRVVELDELPYGLSGMPQVQRVKDWYTNSFTQLREMIRPTSHADEEIFTEVIKGIRSRHSNVVPTLASGINELKRLKGFDFDQLASLNEFLDRFYMSRIGIRMLIGHHVALHEPRPGFIGLIDTKCSAVGVAEDAVNAARNLCLRSYADAPEVGFYGCKDMLIEYHPGHLFHMVFELVKNSMRAVMETHGKSDSLPEIKVIVAEGVEDTCIKISDEGGGIPRSGQPRIWTYLYTTAQAANVDIESDSPYHTDFNAPLAGFGYGLPLSRLYARYFGGDLHVISMEGYGTDAYLYLDRLKDHEEPLP
eukprot:GILJ01005793.1.p1 GENE.GILJ01005793.1~~GILJ01005793.1.p1  ORF type:complete len:367 (+),score=30.31 GILJ01005793.1:93-1193(+)